MTVAGDDLALLRAYEPIVRYTSGELFFPTAVDGYLAACDLWEGRSERDRTRLAGPGELRADRLGTFEAEPGQSLFLRLVQEPMTGLDLARWRLRPDQPRFLAPGRLARVGLFARLVDAAFEMSLLLRGTVPGGTTAAASVLYERVRKADARFVYHGRVVRQDGWIVLQYLFFYFMNDWRSTFGGANDHEADWEQCFVFLDGTADPVRPVWIACAAHDESGDDLRRRWDDPDLTTVGDHPVINAGAGSHASYFEHGEYLTSVPFPGLIPARGLLDAFRTFWRDTLRQGDPGDLATTVERAFSVAFIDYARGDGLAVGPGGNTPWTPTVIGDDVPWVDGYRGLFGLDTYDRFAGERAPAGPKYTRTGNVRETWADPVGWAGLAKVAPPARARAAAESRLTELRADLTELEAADAATTAELRGLEIEVRGLASTPWLTDVHAARAAELRAREAELVDVRRRAEELRESIAATERTLAAIVAGEPGDPQAHLRRRRRPVPPEVTRYGRLVEVWAAVSIGLVLIALVALVYTGVVPIWGAFIVAIGGYVLLEAAFRRRLTGALLRLTVALAAVTAVILVVTFLPQIALAAALAVAGVVLVENIRELSRA